MMTQRALSENVAAQVHTGEKTSKKMSFNSSHRRNGGKASRSECREATNSSVKGKFVEVGGVVVAWINSLMAPSSAEAMPGTKRSYPLSSVRIAPTGGFGSPISD